MCRVASVCCCCCCKCRVVAVVVVVCSAFGCIWGVWERGSRGRTALYVESLIPAAPILPAAANEPVPIVLYVCGCHNMDCVPVRGDCQTGDAAAASESSLTAFAPGCQEVS